MPRLLHFSFCGHVHHRDLHSFPTRRSSDLRQVQVFLNPPGRELRSRASCLTDARSEEHTSELQSRPHLVCRLLLEKKKLKRVAEAPSPGATPPALAPCIRRAHRASKSQRAR